MKRFMIVYAIFSIVLLVFIFFFTIIQESNARSLELFYELADDALITNDLDDFVKYQSIAYQMLDQIETDDYHFHVYQVIAQIGGEYVNQFSVFVIPKSTIDSASVLSDPNDETGILIKDGSTDSILYQTSTDSDYTEYAVSYGIKRIGFYYYAIVLEDSYTLDIILKDYNAQNILSENLDFYHIIFDPLNTGSLTLGYTDQEIETLLNISAYTQPALLENIAMFLVVDIVVGAIIHFILKRKSI
ncbi:MAG: hypothetical protein ABH890_06360 [Bacillota bacterium]